MKREALPATVPDTAIDPVPGPAAHAAATAALKHRPTGTHVLADLGGIAAEKLCSCESLDALLPDLIAKASRQVDAYGREKSYGG